MDIGCKRNKETYEWRMLCIKKDFVQLGKHLINVLSLKSLRIIIMKWKLFKYNKTVLLKDISDHLSGIKVFDEFFKFSIVNLSLYRSEINVELLKLCCTSGNKSFMGGSKNFTVHVLNEILTILSFHWGNILVILNYFNLKILAIWKKIKLSHDFHVCVCIMSGTWHCLLGIYYLRFPLTRFGILD